MRDQVLVIASPLLALGCGLIGGVFFAFSTFIMKALARLSPAHGAAAMQSINVVVLNRWFLGVFFGTAAGCAVVLTLALLERPADHPWLIAGALLYLAGSLLVTLLANVPRNDRLAALDPEGIDTPARWAEYLSEWTFWNHVRTAASALAALAFCLASMSGAAA